MSINVWWEKAKELYGDFKEATFLKKCIIVLWSTFSFLAMLLLAASFAAFFTLYYAWTIQTIYNWYVAYPTNSATVSIYYVAGFLFIFDLVFQVIRPNTEGNLADIKSTLTRNFLKEKSSSGFSVLFIVKKLCAPLIILLEAYILSLFLL